MFFLLSLFVDKETRKSQSFSIHCFHLKHASSLSFFCRLLRCIVFDNIPCVSVWSEWYKKMLPEQKVTAITFIAHDWSRRSVCSVSISLKRGAFARIRSVHFVHSKVTNESPYLERVSAFDERKMTSSEAHWTSHILLVVAERIAVSIVRYRCPWDCSVQCSHVGGRGCSSVRSVHAHCTIKDSVKREVLKQAWLGSADWKWIDEPTLKLWLSFWQLLWENASTQQTRTLIRTAAFHWPSQRAWLINPNRPENISKSGWYVFYMILIMFLIILLLRKAGQSV